MAYFNPGSDGLYALYDQKLRTPLFTGFLTLGGFLLTLKTFVLVQLKKELYETQFYKERIISARNLKGPNSSTLTLYGPLDRLGTLLIFCVISALATAASQFLIGLIPSAWTAAFCIGLAAASFVLVFLGWFQIRQNLRGWFDFLNDKAEQELAEAREKMLATQQASPSKSTHG